MNSFILLPVLMAFCCLANGQLGPCRTPYGAQGSCISLYDCPNLLAITKTQATAQETALLRNSLCGYVQSIPAVCCEQKTTTFTTAPPPPPPPQEVRCFTPEGKQGKCIGLYSCPDIAQLLSAMPVSDEKLQYVTRSRCQGTDQYSVCCGPVPSFNERIKEEPKPQPQPQPQPQGKCVSVNPPDASSGCCGIDSVSSNKIFGGDQASIDQYPWLVLVEYRRRSDGAMKTYCGAALISSKYVLTAGHCVKGRILEKGTPKNVLLGEYDTSNEGPDCQEADGGGEDCTDGMMRIRIEKAIPHPQYDPTHQDKRHDIALIRMLTLAPWTEFIRPICLPTGDISTRTDRFNTTVAGWGAISDRERKSETKLFVVLPFITKNVCQVPFNQPSLRVNLWKGQICAGGEAGKDSCSGDSGGPLMYERELKKDVKIHEVIGVVSFGHTNCGTAGVPGIYSYVYEYIPWINSNITP